MALSIIFSLTLLQVVCVVTQGPVLTAYDCDTVTGVYEYESEVAECVRMDSSAYQEPKVAVVQILAQRETIPVEGFHCMVRISHAVMLCGATSVVYPTKHTLTDYLVPMERDECAKMIKEKMYRFVSVGIDGYKDQETVVHFETDKRNKAIMYTRGGVDGNGNCLATSYDRFQSGKESLRSTVISSWSQLTTFEIEAGYLTGQLDMKKQRVVFADIDKDYRAENLLDQAAGYVFWSEEEHPCDAGFIITYEGNATLTRLKERATAFLEENPGHGDILVIEDEGVSGGMQLEDTFAFCTTKLVSTNMDKVFVNFVWSNFDNLTTLSRAFETQVYAAKKDVLSTVVRSRLEDKLANGRTVDQIRMAICQVERQQLQTQIDIILSGNEKAIRQLYGRPGVRVVEGAGVHFVHFCKEVNVTLSFYKPNCTIELAVNHNNVTMFRDESTKILTPFPTPVPCSRINPPLFKWDGHWHQRVEDGGYEVRRNVIKVMRPKNFALVSHDDTVGKMDLSMYTPGQQEMVRERNRLDNTRRAILPILSQTASMNSQKFSNGDGTSGVRFGSILDGTDQSLIKISVDHLFSPMWRLFAEWVSYVASVMGLFMLISWAFAVALRIRQVFKLDKHYRKRRLCSVFCDGLYDAIAFPFVMVRRVKSRLQKEQTEAAKAEFQRQARNLQLRHEEDVEMQNLHPNMVAAHNGNFVHISQPMRLAPQPPQQAVLDSYESVDETQKPQKPQKPYTNFPHNLHPRDPFLVQQGPSIPLEDARRIAALKNKS